MTKDMTKGHIMPMLIRFSIPVILGNLFQLTYNAVDSIIVGRYVGKGALAAVGICNPIMTLLILFLNGLSMGAAIIMGTQFGAKDYETLKREISTTLISGSIFSLTLTILGIIFAGPLLRLMRVHDDIYILTLEYIRIIFMGLGFTFLYNFFASSLRALGDSTRPLYFLIISAILNVFGDLFFVIVLKWGVIGCAVSTVVSEALAALFCFVYIQLEIEALRFKRENFVFDRELFKKTVSYGWVSAMQQATVQMGKIGIQGMVDTMGVSVAAAFTSVNRVDDFAYTPQQNIGHSMTALMAQNKGAGKSDRLLSGFKCGMILELCYGIAVFIACFCFARTIMSFFSKDYEVIKEGVSYLRLISFMYILPAMTNGVQGYFRGIGDLKITLLSSFVNMGVRVLAAIPLVFFMHLGIEALPYSYLAGWLAMLLVECPLLYKSIRENMADKKSCKIK